MNVSISGFGFPTELLDVNGDNTTSLSCREIQERGFPLPLEQTTADLIRSLQVCYFIVSLLVGTGLNVFLIVIIIRYKRLHTITLRCALQIIVVDLAHAVIIYPSSATNAIAGTLVFRGLCSVLGFIITLFRIARAMLMTMLMVDKFCTVYLPFWYNRNRVKMVVITSLMSWVVSILVALVAVSGLLDCYTFQQFTWACQLGEGCANRVACTTFRTILTTTMTVGLFIAFLLYAALILKARKIRNRIATTTNGVEGVSNGSIAARKMAQRDRVRERRANTTFFILFLSLVGVSFFPYLFFTFGNIALDSLNLNPPPPAYIILAIIARSPYVSLIIWDPIVILRNGEVREVVTSIKAKLKISRHHHQSMNSSTNERATTNTVDV